MLLFLSLYFIFLLTWDHFSALFIILYVFLKVYKDWFKSMYVKISIKKLTNSWSAKVQLIPDHIFFAGTCPITQYKISFSRDIATHICFQLISVVSSIGWIMFHCFFGQLLAERYALRLINLYKSLILQKKLLHQSLKVKKSKKSKSKEKEENSWQRVHRST